MNLTRLEKIIIGIGLLVLLVIVTNTLITSPVSKANSTVIKGHFKTLIKEVNRGDASYDFYLYESPDYYRISADWSGCFLYDDFKKEVTDGQPVTIYLYSGLHLIAGKQIVAIVVNKRDYLFTDCINQKISDNKIFLPLGCLAIFAFGLLYLYEKRRKVPRTDR